MTCSSPMYSRVRFSKGLVSTDFCKRHGLRFYYGIIRVSHACITYKGMSNRWEEVFRPSKSTVDTRSKSRQAMDESVSRVERKEGRRVTE